jgi:ElaB/YqjD/DUF883 family membrane-anchored ribosome-binding protein
MNRKKAIAPLQEGGPVPLENLKPRRTLKMEAQDTVQAAEDIRKRAEKGYESARERMSEAGEQFETFSSNARQNAEAAWEKTIDLIQENPVSALGIALLVGAGVGALLTAWASD